MARNLRVGALAGVAAAGVALGVGEVVAVLVSPRSSPLVAVGGVVIDQVPESGKELAIRLFGTNDKAALQVGTILILVGIAALLGMWAVRRLWIGLVGIGAFGAVGVASALTRVGASATWALPSLLGAVAAGGALWLLLGPVAGLAGQAAASTAALGSGTPSSGTPSPTVPSPTVPSPTVPSPTAPGPLVGTRRRRFLALSWAMIGGAAIAGVLGRSVGQSAGVNQARRAVTLPTPSGPTAVAPPEASVAGLSYVTTNDTFYRIDTALVIPRVDPTDWSLLIHGRVRNPMRLTYAELIRRPMIERYITLACVSNEVGGDLIGNARWLGVPVKELLAEAGPEEGADQVVSRSVDGFTAGTPTEVLRDGRDALVAIAMNGEPLPLAHGFPVRMVVPGLYGYVSATKWLAELELTSFADFDAYWIPRGWAQQAPIKTQSRIDRPRPGSTVAAGDVVVAGVAWAQHRGISAVEVRVDDGPWRPAALAATVSIDTWRLWSLIWQATPGRHTLAVRAADNAGEVQTGVRARPAPNGATGWHTIGVTVV